MLDLGLFPQTGVHAVFIATIVLGIFPIILSAASDNIVSLWVSLLLTACAVVVAYLSRSVAHEILAILLYMSALISASVLYGAAQIAKAVTAEAENSREALPKAKPQEPVPVLAAPVPVEARPTDGVEEYRGIRYTRNKDLSISSDVTGEVVSWPNIMAFRSDVDEYLDATESRPLA
ncbi:hypothetical protein GCM10007301_43480 [Azorhizobium oxalatiphilum]|uniref:Uncharacterized protein n=1 Tax=Azorhizobium oxalatiphilum TaxID=980631 RepID=A0A917CBP0_9HYPH|nr:hypothetical protein [Azorhizobium oxalatiphilum]GGF78768.1 hypothetical protein GCM10007301_43480 [Azorhizobium oxalatiphilum]